MSINKFFKNIGKAISEKTLLQDDSSQFRPIIVEIEESPVSPLGRTTFWVLVVIILTVSIWSYIGKVDIIIPSRGKIIPNGEIKIIQPLDAGVIGKIAVEEGSFVKKGNVLIEIDPSATAPEVESTKKTLSEVSLEIKRLKAAVTGRPFYASPEDDASAVALQASLYAASANELLKQIQVKKLDAQRVEEQIKTAKSQKANYKSLLDTAIKKEKRLKPALGIIARDEYEKVTSDIGTYKANIDESNNKLRELSYQSNQSFIEADSIMQNYRKENIKELAEKEKQSTQLRANLKQMLFKNKKQTITAPEDGYINTLFVHTVGGIVTPAQKLMSLVPSKSNLIIKADVLSKDIGFIKKGMDVSIKLDTFDFQKYGMVKGVVKDICKDSIDDPKQGSIYNIYITPMTKELIVDGHKQPISTGMTLSAEVNVGKRRVIEFFIYPLIKYLDEGLSVK